MQRSPPQALHPPPVNARELTIILGLVAGLGVTAFLGLSGQSAEAGVAIPGTVAGAESDLGPIETVPAPVQVESAGTESPQLVRAISDGIAPDELEPGQTTGVIEGRVQIAARLVGQVEYFQIRVTELVNTSTLGNTSTRTPYDRMAPAAFRVPHDRTPRFRIEDIPFSPFGYRVTLSAKGCNGSSDIARVDATHPLADVTLSMTSPVVFTLRVQDQNTKPHAEWDLTLRPLGDPPGRLIHSARTDAFGHALIENVVQGRYAVWHGAYQIGEIEVESAVVPRRGRPINVQSALLVVPTGEDLRVEVFTPGGGLPDANIKLVRTDATDYWTVEAKTDFGGSYVFEALTPGSYQLDIWHERHQRTTRTVRIKEGTPPERLQITLVPLR